LIFYIPCSAAKAAAVNKLFLIAEKKLSAQFCISKKKFLFFQKKSGDLVYTFYYFYDTHSPQPLLGQVFLNWIRAQKIDRLTLIVRAHLFIARKKAPIIFFGYDIFTRNTIAKKGGRDSIKMGRECLTFIPNDGSYRCPFVSIIKNLIRDNE
jgi:hypothetical protein